METHRARLDCIASSCAIGVLEVELLSGAQLEAPVYGKCECLKRQSVSEYPRPPIASQCHRWSNRRDRVGSGPKVGANDYRLGAILCWGGRQAAAERSRGVGHGNTKMTPAPDFGVELYGAPEGVQHLAY